MAMGPDAMNDADINICLDPLSVRLDDEQMGSAGRHRGCDLRAQPQRSASPGCADSVVVAANCSGEPLIAFTNGQTGAINPDQQGENAAILDQESPLNILKEVPETTAQSD
jgi:hypothetical protein